MNRMGYTQGEVTITSLDDFVLNELFENFISKNGVIGFSEEHMHNTINWYSDYVGRRLHRMYGIEQKGE